MLERRYSRKTKEKINIFTCSPKHINQVAKIERVKTTLRASQLERVGNNGASHCKTSTPHSRIVSYTKPNLRQIYRKEHLLFGRKHFWGSYLKASVTDLNDKKTIHRTHGQEQTVVKVGANKEKTFHRSLKSIVNMCRANLHLD